MLIHIFSVIFSIICKDKKICINFHLANISLRNIKMFFVLVSFPSSAIFSSLDMKILLIRILIANFISNNLLYTWKPNQTLRFRDNCNKSNYAAKIHPATVILTTSVIFSKTCQDFNHSFFVCVNFLIHVFLCSWIQTQILIFT